MAERTRVRKETTPFENPDAPPATTAAPAGGLAARTGINKPGAPLNALEEPYLLLPAGGGLDRKSRAFCQNKVDTFVKAGGLTPVLGSETTSAEVVPGQSITVDPYVEAVLAADPELWTFYRDLVNGRRHGRTSAPHASEDRCAAADAAVGALRLALLKTLYTATSLYAGLWTETVAPLYDWPAHSLPLDVSASPFHELRVHLADAILALDDFRNAQSVEQEERDHRSALLGLDGLSNALDSLDHALESEAVLRGTTVEWLGGVLWHVLIFDSPCYPTREELALQVSFNDDSEIPIRKVELTALSSGGINQHWDRYGHAMSRTLVGLKGGSAPVPAVGRLHAALAASLNLSYSRWRDPLRKTQPLPLAITLTTDLELERALACDTRGAGFYHVAFPMILTNLNHNGRGHLRWVVGKFRAGFGADQGRGTLSWSDLTEPLDGWRLLNDEAVGMRLSAFSPSQAPGLQGPLLLKASGSPLHVVKESLADHAHVQAGFVSELGETGSAVRREGRADGEIRHVPATTELEILQLTQVDQWAMGASNGRAGLHEAIRSSFSQPRRGWLILGHDLGEWSSRLQLFTQISLSTMAQPATEMDYAQSKVQEWSLAVVGHADEQRARLLLGLDIPLTDHSQFPPETIATSIHTSLAKVGWGTSAHGEAGL